MESETSEIKQDYLRNEILEGGFEADHFLEFLIGKKGDDAANVDNWRFDELKEVVEEYKKLYSNKIEKETETIQTNELTRKKTDINILGYSLDPYEEVVTCKKQEKTPLVDCHNVKVILSE